MKKEFQPLTIVLYTEGLHFSGDTIEKQALGGSETAFIYVARKLAEMGHKVYAYCPCSDPGIFNGVIYNDTSELKIWFEQPCDIFICSRYFYIFFQPIQAKVKLLWLHDIFMQQNAANFQLIRPSLHAVFCLSEFHCEITRQVIPSVNSILRKSINGIDQLLAEKSRKEISKKVHRIMFTSRPERGLINALEIYQRLDDKTLELLICSYNSLDDSEVDKVERECNQKISELISQGFPIYKNSFPKAVLYQKISESKLVLYPTDFPEIFCISAIEAQACGTVMLASDAFAMKETVHGNRIPMGNMDAFCEAARSIIYDDEKRRLLEINGLGFAKSFTWDHVAAQFVNEAMQYLDPDIKPISHVTTFSRNEKLNGDLPLVSCLTLTSNRLTLLKQAISCYCEQTYPNRELVIVNSGTQRYHEAISRHIFNLGREDVRLVHIVSKSPMNMGALRNISLDNAQGELICNWDDDDLYHSRRIELQYRCLMENKATVCYMTDHLQFFEPQKQMYWIDWTRLRHASEEGQCVPGSMLAFYNKAIRYNENQHLGEDGTYRNRQSNAANEVVATLNGHGYLYVYRFHGRNSYALPHYRHITAWGNSSSDYIRMRKKELVEALSHYPLPKPLLVKDIADQTVFVYA